MKTNQSWIDLAHDACTQAGVEYETIEIAATWDEKYCANAVYRIGGQRYLKIFGPTAERQFHIERSVLKTLATQDVIPAPRLIVEGNSPGHPPYIILTEILGATAEDVWEELSRSEQLATARRLGAITAAIHRLPRQELAAVERQFGGRHEHIKRYQERCLATIKAAENLSIQQRDDLLHFIYEEAPALLNAPLKFTHSELAHNHIYLNKQNDGWAVTGFIDWADAMLGAAEWDLTFLWFWTFSGDREAMQHCLQTFYADGSRPDQLARRCLAAIIHTHALGLLLPQCLAEARSEEPIVPQIIDSMFPEEVFGR